MKSLLRLTTLIGIIGLVGCDTPQPIEATNKVPLYIIQKGGDWEPTFEKVSGAELTFYFDCGEGKGYELPYLDNYQTVINCPDWNWGEATAGIVLSYIASGRVRYTIVNLVIAAQVGVKQP